MVRLKPICPSCGMDMEPLYMQVAIDRDYPKRRTFKRVPFNYCQHCASRSYYKNEQQKEYGIYPV